MGLYSYGPKMRAQPSARIHRNWFTIILNPSLALERLWAYLTIKNLLELVAKGDLNSCTSDRVKRSIRPIRATVSNSDDEDYNLEGSGDLDDDEYYYVEEESESEAAVVESIMDEVGDDDDIVICDNIEYALYLSLKYEFVTPLTSLVVVGPDDAEQEGDLSEAAGGHSRRHTIHMLSGCSDLQGLEAMLLLLLSSLIALIRV